MNNSYKEINCGMKNFIFNIPTLPLLNPIRFYFRYLRSKLRNRSFKTPESVMKQIMVVSSKIPEEKYG